MSNPALQGPARVFAALGEESRLRLVARLCAGGPTSIAQLTTGSGVTRQAITKHLHVLANAGLVRAVRQGRECLWKPKLQNLELARHYLDLISQQWDEALGRLKVFVER